MGGPSRMRDTSMGVEDFCCVGLGLFNKRLELCNLASLFESEDLVSFIAVDSQAGRIVSTVFQTAQA